MTSDLNEVQTREELSFQEKSSRENLTFDELRRVHEPVPDNLPPRGDRILQVGVAFVIGAVAANVFGFRQSRWAVGKDLHRAWERSTVRRNATQARQQQQDRRAASKSDGNASGSNHSAEFRRAHSRSPNEIFDEFDRQAEARARDSVWQHEASRRSSGRGGSDGGGPRNTRTRDARSTSHGKWRGSWQKAASSTRFTVNFDSGASDEMLRNLRREGPDFRARPSSQRFPFHDFPDLAELLREAHKAQTDSKVRGAYTSDSDFDADAWEHIFGTNGRTPHGGYSRSRTSSQPNPFTGLKSSLGPAYRWLGLREGAGKDEVKAAYRRQAIKFHPDTYVGSDHADAARKFREVTAAYRQLKDIN